MWSVRVSLALALSAAAFSAGCTQVAELPPASPATGGSPETAAVAADRPRDAERGRARAPAWLASEASAFEHVQAVLEEAGFPEVRTAVFRVADDVPMPAYRPNDRALLLPPFTGGADRMRERLARMSADHFSGTLTFVEAFADTDEAYDAYRAFFVVAIAHELWHHIQFLRKGAAAPTALSAYRTESEAIELEQAFLEQQVHRKDVPVVWRDHYRRAVMSIRDAIPRYAIETLPTDKTELEQRFADAYRIYGLSETQAGDDTARSPNTAIDAAAVVYAGYTQKRIALFSKRGRSLAELARDEAALKKSSSN